MHGRPRRSTLFPYTTLFRSLAVERLAVLGDDEQPAALYLHGLAANRGPDFGVAHWRLMAVHHDDPDSVRLAAHVRRGPRDGHPVADDATQHGKVHSSFDLGIGVLEEEISKNTKEQNHQREDAQRALGRSLNNAGPILGHHIGSLQQ